MLKKPLQRLSLEKLKLKLGLAKAKALQSLQQRGSVENMELPVTALLVTHARG